METGPREWYLVVTADGECLIPKATAEILQRMFENNAAVDIVCAREVPQYWEA